MKGKAAIGIILLFVVSFIFNIYQYVDKQKYVEELSWRLYSDFYDIFRTLESNDEILGEIIASNGFTYEQFDWIVNNNFRFFERIQRWETIAVHFNRIEQRQLEEFPEVLLRKSTNVFYDRLWEMAEDQEVDRIDHITLGLEKDENISLSPEQIEFLKRMEEYNNDLYMSFYDHMDGLEIRMNNSEIGNLFSKTFLEKGYKSNIWEKILLSWHDITREFLEEHKNVKEFQDL